MFLVFQADLKISSNGRYRRPFFRQADWSHNGLGQRRKGHAELKLIMSTVMAKFTDETTLLIPGIKGKINDRGEITDPATIENLGRFAAAFKLLLNWILQVRTIYIWMIRTAILCFDTFQSHILFFGSYWIPSMQVSAINSLSETSLVISSAVTVCSETSDTGCSDSFLLSFSVTAFCEISFSAAWTSAKFPLAA